MSSMSRILPSFIARYKDILIYVGEVLVAVLIGFIIAGLLMAWGGFDPIKAYASLFKYSFTSVYAISMTLSFATPLMLTALTFAIGVRAGLFNIGAEGQMYMGALGAIIVASWALPAHLYLPLEFLIGIGLGVLWGLIAGVLKMIRGVNEVVSTIMLNWIAFWIVEYSRVYVYPDPHDPSKTIKVPPAGRLPLLVKGTELSASIIVAVIIVALIYYLLWHTVMGYELRASGMSPYAASYGGINVKKTILYAFLLGGVTASIAGIGEVAGRPPSYCITTGLSNIFGLGFDGIAVSLIGGNHPIGIIPAAIFVGALTAGSRGMQIEAGVPLEMVKAVQGIIVVALALPGLIRMIRQIRIARRGVEE
ncbi:MAG: ABC transporter permease [Thermoprotei archaeon]